MSRGLDRAAYETVLADVWPEIRRAFNYPLVARVRLTDGTSSPDRSGDGTGRDASGAEIARLGGTSGGAGYRWDANELVVSVTHLDRLAPADEAELERLLRPLLKHELGHYACFPRELFRHLLYLDRARTAFGDGLGPSYYAVYADVCDDLRLLESHVAGEDLLRLRRRTAESLPDDGTLSAPRRAAIRRVQRLMLGLYQATFADLPSVVEPTDAEARYVDRLGDIRYLDDGTGTHERNLVLFGNVLSDVLSDLPRSALDGLGTPEDRGKARGERPFSGDAVERIPDARLDDAVSAALLEDGTGAYERLADFLEDRAGFADPYDREAGGGAGLDRADLERNDDRVPFYRRWASGHPVFVADRPQSVEEAGHYRRGRRRYEPGDPLREVNPFASLGLVGVPGVSQTDVFSEGTAAVERPGVPDLLVGIDSSGSMPDPAVESHAVLAAFVLAETYYRSGADVGGYNFSADVAFLPPGRDLDTLHALLCARWGGGTLLDWETLTGFVGRMDRLDGVVLSEESDHEAALERLAADDVQRNPGPDSPPGSSAVPEVDPTFETVDHVLVTDGELANEEEAAGFLEGVSEHARNLLFLTDDSRYEAWAGRDIPETWVYAAADPEDLVALAVGQGRRLAGGERRSEANEDGRPEPT